MKYAKNPEIMFRHFSSRLSERYGVLITYEYYLTLCELNLRCRKVQRDANGFVISTRGYLIINDVRVKVVKSLKKGRYLITALPLKNTRNDVQNLPNL